LVSCARHINKHDRDFILLVLKEWHITELCSTIRLQHDAYGIRIFKPTAFIELGVRGGATIRKVAGSILDGVGIFH